MDLTKPATQKKLAALGAALISCCSACLIALVIGVSTKGALSELINQPSTGQLSPVDLAKPPQTVDKLLLRKRLEIIGASKSEIQRIMTPAEKADYKAAVDSIAKATSGLVAAYDELSEEDRQKLDAASDTFSHLMALSRIFGVLKGELEKDAGRGDVRVSLSLSDFRPVFDRLFSNLFG